MMTHLTHQNNQTTHKPQKLLASLWLLSCFFLLPEIAMANPIEDGVDWLLDLLTNGIARSVAIIGIVALGYLAWAGKIYMDQCLKFIAGIVLVFGGASIVDLIIAAVSGS